MAAHFCCEDCTAVAHICPGLADVGRPKRLNSSPPITTDHRPPLLNQNQESKIRKCSVTHIRDPHHRQALPILLNLPRDIEGVVSLQFASPPWRPATPFRRRSYKELLYPRRFASQIPRGPPTTFTLSPTFRARAPLEIPRLPGLIVLIPFGREINLRLITL